MKWESGAELLLWVLCMCVFLSFSC